MITTLHIDGQMAKPMSAHLKMDIWKDMANSQWVMEKGNISVNFQEIWKLDMVKWEHKLVLIPDHLKMVRLMV
jgi:hypothetical protein